MRVSKRQVLSGLLAVAVTGCTSKFPTYRGPEVTKLEVHKTDRVLKVFHGNTLLARHRVELGFGPTGHKQFEGDGRTPEGRYYIDRRNPNSSFYLSLGISYPSRRDIAFARSKGLSPGWRYFPARSAQSQRRIRSGLDGGMHCGDKQGNAPALRDGEDWHDHRSVPLTLSRQRPSSTRSCPRVPETTTGPYYAHQAT